MALLQKLLVVFLYHVMKTIFIQLETGELTK